MVKHKGINICPFINLFVYRFSGAVSGINVYPQDHWMLALVFSLKLRCKFKGMCRNNPVVVISGNDHDEFVPIEEMVRARRLLEQLVPRRCLDV